MVEAPHQVQGILTHGEGGGQEDVGGDTVGGVVLGQLDVPRVDAGLWRGGGPLAGEQATAGDIDLRKEGTVVNVIIAAGAVVVVIAEGRGLVAVAEVPGTEGAPGVLIPLHSCIGIGTRRARRQSDSTGGGIGGGFPVNARLLVSLFYAKAIAGGEGAATLYAQQGTHDVTRSIPAIYIASGVAGGDGTASLCAHQATHSASVSSSPIRSTGGIAGGDGTAPLLAYQATHVISSTNPALHITGGIAGGNGTTHPSCQGHPRNHRLQPRHRRCRWNGWR